MKMLKKALFIAAALVVFAGAQAQTKGDQAVGAGLVFATGDMDNFGIGLKYQYNITNAFRLEPAFTYYFEKEHVSGWDLMANLHYILPVAPKVNLYPLAGLGIFGAKAKVGGEKATDSAFQFNFGCGAEYEFSPTWAGIFEFKYKMSDIDFANFVLGVSYKF